MFIKSDPKYQEPVICFIDDISMEFVIDADVEINGYITLQCAKCHTLYQIPHEYFRNRVIGETGLVMGAYIKKNEAKIGA